MKRIGVILVIIAALFVGFGYNSLVSGSQSVSQSWSQVEVQMQRRYDLIPNLVTTTQKYIDHEKGIFEKLSADRAAFAGAHTKEEKSDAADALSTTVGRLIAIAENYPDLKANQTMQQLMDELAGTENRMSTERMRYNRAVQSYNVLVKSFPMNILANAFGYSTETYLKAKEVAHEVPQVSFK